MPIASDAVVDALNATLATTRKAEASAMASQEEAGHADAPCEWRGLVGRKHGPSSLAPGLQEHLPSQRDE